MDLIKISELNQRNEIDINDFFPLVDSGSKTTHKSTMNILDSWAETYGTASHVFNADLTPNAFTTSYAGTASYALTASHLYYTASFPVNGTASFVLNAGLAYSASYIDASTLVAAYATNVLSASWASSSVSSSYILSTNIEGVLTTSSYVITASHAITASFLITASFVETASNVGTSSTAQFAINVAAGTPFTIYGPFFADPTSTLPTIEGGQYDETKRSVAFILEEQSDVIIKCLMNHNSRRLANAGQYYRFVGVKVKGEGLPDPIIQNLTDPFYNSDFDGIEMDTVRDIDDGGGHTEATTEIIFRINDLLQGQHRVHFIPCFTDKNIGVMEYSVSASMDQLGDYQAFNADQITQAEDMKFLKFRNSAQVLVYAKQNVIQGIYTPGEAVSWKIWRMTYSVNNNTIVNGLFEYEYTYDSSLGGGTAIWIGPDGSPGQEFTIEKCLPSDHTLMSIVGGPIGVIVTPPHVTSTPCGS